VQVNIGKKWKDVIDYNDKITYTFHVCLQILPLFAPHSTFSIKKTLVRTYQVLNSLQLSHICRMTPEERSPAEVDGTPCKVHIMKDRGLDWIAGVECSSRHLLSFDSLSYCARQFSHLL